MTIIYVRRLAPRDWVAWTNSVPFRGEGLSKAEAVGDLFVWMADLDLEPLIEIHEVFDEPTLVAAAGKGGAA